MPRDNEEADRLHRDASSPSFAKIASAGRAACLLGEFRLGWRVLRKTGSSYWGHLGLIHFDSVDSALEAAVLRHVTQLAAAPVIVDRPGGVVHSDRELRIVAPNTGDAAADEAAAVAIEFGVLRGLLDLVAPDARGSMRWNGAGKSLLRGDEGGLGAGGIQGVALKKKWWPFAVVLLVGALGVLRRGAGRLRLRWRRLPGLGGLRRHRSIRFWKATGCPSEMFGVKNLRHLNLRRLLGLTKAHRQECLCYLNLLRLGVGCSGWGRSKWLWKAAG